MGRAGGGGGGSRSGGGHSGGSRSSGGHRIGGGSNRAGQGMSRSSNHSYNSSYHRSSRHSYNRGYGYGGTTIINRNDNPISTLIVAILVIVVLAFSFISSNTSSVKSTIQRTKLESGVGFDSNCIKDELGWFNNTSKTGTKLKDFYNKTGVQPYIVFTKYDSNVTSDSQKEDWAEQYYEDNIDREDAFLFVYFAEKNIDDVGYMCYVNGHQTSSVMDAEAVDIFWGYLDKYWYSDATTDDMIVKTFDNTANTIMRVSTTGADVGMVFVIGIIIVAVLIIAFCWWKKKRQAEKERAEETERILNTPMQELADEPKSELEDKYL